MAEPYLAEIHYFAFNYAPPGYAQCNGQLLPVSQNAALYSLIGVTYGGNGTSNFALPDLQGRIPIGVGTGYALGAKGGSVDVTLTTNTIPTHTHTLQGVPAGSGAGTQSSPQGAMPAAEALNQTAVYKNVAPNSFSGMTLPGTGSNAAHTNLSPFLTLNYCIALQGIYPSRP